MNTQTYKIKGMHCASCAVMIEKEFKKAEGVSVAEANYGTEAVKVSFDESVTNPTTLSKKIEPLGYSLIIPDLKVENKNIEHDMKNMSANEMGMSENEHAEHLGLNQSKKEKLAELASMRNMIFSAMPITIVAIFVM